MPRIASGAQRRQARLALDRRLAATQQASSALTVPRTGWVRAIRTSLGMSSADLAIRMSVAQSTVARLEQSEINGTAQLDTLRRAAAALNCDLVYALVPRETLESTVQRQALKRATESIDAVQHSMRLEQQSVAQSMTETLLAREAEEWQMRLGLWNE
jgi:predicted DNA-binding mobile mystery protein A